VSDARFGAATRTSQQCSICSDHVGSWHHAIWTCSQRRQQVDDDNDGDDGRCPYAARHGHDEMTTHLAWPPPTGASADMQRQASRIADHLLATRELILARRYDKKARGRDEGPRRQDGGQPGVARPGGCPARPTRPGGGGPACCPPARATTSTCTSTAATATDDAARTVDPQGGQPLQTAPRRRLYGKTPPCARYDTATSATSASRPLCSTDDAAAGTATRLAALSIPPRC
jgi:hypothetical protein